MLAFVLLAGTLLVAAHLLVRVPETGFRIGAIARAATGFVQVIGVGLAPLGTVTGELDPFAYYELLAAKRHFSSVSSDVLAFAALATVLDRLDTRDEVPTRRTLLGLLFVTVVIPRFGTMANVAVGLVELATGAWLVTRALRESFGTMRENTGEKLYCGLAAVTFFEALLSTEFLRVFARDVHLHDTYFLVGVFHLEVVCTFFAIVALLYRNTTGKAAPRRAAVSASVAGGLSFVGTHAFHFSVLTLGARGMPRRYANYLPEFQTLHVVATIGAFVLVSGIVAGLLDIFVDRRVAQHAPF